MRISTKGIHFVFMGRTWVWNWWWRRSPTIFTYNAEKINLTFKTFEGLAEFCATTEELTNERHKTEGFDFQDIIQQWILNLHPEGIILVLTNIDVGAKPYAFWSVMSKPEALAFTKDVVVLRCHSLEEMKRICDSIPTKFASAQAYCNGNPIYSNEE